MVAILQALERVAGLLEGVGSSIVLSERGDMAPIARHPNFRLLAAMNPATDSGNYVTFVSPTRNKNMHAGALRLDWAFSLGTFQKQHLLWMQCSTQLTIVPLARD